MEPNCEKEGRGGDERRQTAGDQVAARIPSEEMVDVCFVPEHPLI